MDIPLVDRIVIRPVSDLVPYAQNAKAHPPAQIQALADSIKRRGFLVPVLVAGDSVVAGHGRLLAAQQVGLDRVPTIDVSHLSEAEVRAFRIADNKISESEWLDDMLRVELEALRGEGMLEASGFTAAELDAMLRGEEPPGDAEPQMDKAAELQERWQVKRGDVWTMPSRDGKRIHRVMCGDSTDSKDVGKVSEGKPVALVFTSPPYAQQRDYTEASSHKDWDGMMRGAFGNLPADDKTQVLVNLGLVHKDGEWWPYWDGWIEWMRAQGWRRFGWYVWDQGPGLPGDWNGRLSPAFEWVFHFNHTVRKANKTIACAHAGEKNHGRGLRGKDGCPKGYTHLGRDVQPFKIPDSVLRTTREKRSSQIQAAHPAPYPVEFPSLIVGAYTCDGESIFDPFLGSGTTLIAAENLARVCYGIEIEPNYCAVILQRYQDAFSVEPARG